LIFCGRHPEQPIMQVLELSSHGEQAPHPFFIAAQFHPELTGRPLRPQPLFMGLVAAAIARKYAMSTNDLAMDPALARWVYRTADPATVRA